MVDPHTSTGLEQVQWTEHALRWFPVLSPWLLRNRLSCSLITAISTVTEAIVPKTPFCCPTTILDLTVTVGRPAQTGQTNLQDAVIVQSRISGSIMNSYQRRQLRQKIHLEHWSYDYIVSVTCVLCWTGQHGTLSSWSGDARSNIVLIYISINQRLINVN